jgi:acetyl esterase
MMILVSSTFLLLLQPTKIISSPLSFLHQQKVYAVKKSITINKQLLRQDANKVHQQLVKSYFIFPSLKAFFGPAAVVNATKQADAAMLSGKWTIQQSRAIANEFSSLTKKENKPSPQMKSTRDYYVPISDGKERILLRLYDPGVKQKPSPLLIYVHGGGWIVGNIDIFDDSIRRLANSSGLMVAAMNYRLAPEHPFPAGLDDVVSTIRWIASNGQKIGIDTKKMALGGDSAGANLALSSALTLRDSNNNKEHNLFRVLYLMYGPYSPNLLNSTSMKKFGGGDFGLTYGQMKYAMSQTFQNASDYKNPLAFPLLDKNLTGLSPVYIAAMALDPLKDDSIQLASRFQQSGQEYYMAIWPGVAHGALSLIPVTSEIQKYLDAMTIYLKGVLTQS